jgi:predicted metal-dependent phosphotriesterase family hydrolase
MSGPVVTTVLGDIPAAALGRTNAHEHLLMRDPALRGEELDDLGRSAAELGELCDSGFDAVIELTPLGLGRDPAGLAELSRRTGAHIVMATGVHHEDHYPPAHPLRDAEGEALAARFVTDLRDGADGTSVRAGVIKAGAGYWRISPFERRVLEAAAAAHAATGAPVACHLERGTAAFEVLALLTSNGVPADRVLLAHIDRNPDPGLHAELAATGAFLGYDGWARAKYWPDSMLIDCLLETAARGGRERILLGGDVARRSAFRAYGGMPGLAYLGERVLPRLRAAAGDDLVEDLIVANPRRLLAS